MAEFENRALLVRGAADFSDSKDKGARNEHEREKAALDRQKDCPHQRKAHSGPNKGCQPKFFHKARDRSVFPVRGKPE